MLRPASLFLALAACAATSLFPRVASADAGLAAPHCDVLIFPHEGTAPANLPAIVLGDPGSTGVGAVTLTSTTPTFDLGLTSDPRRPGVMLWVPSAPFTAGVTYSLVYALQCSDTKVPPSTDTAWSFKAAAAVPQPTTIGTAREFADGTAVVTPSPELRAFLETTSFEVLVDGRLAGFTPYGYSRGDELEVSLGSGTLSVGHASVSGGSIPACPDTASVQKHTLTVNAHVAGAVNDPPPLTISVAVDCAAYAVPVIPDAGSTATSSGATSDGGGCAMSSNEGTGGIAASFAIGLVLATVLRQRRRAP